jgi:hypothetical protein
MQAREIALTMFPGFTLFWVISRLEYSAELKAIHYIASHHDAVAL